MKLAFTPILKQHSLGHLVATNSPSSSLFSTSKLSKNTTTVRLHYKHYQKEHPKCELPFLVAVCLQNSKPILELLENADYLKDKMKLTSSRRDRIPSLIIENCSIKGLNVGGRIVTYSNGTADSTKRYCWGITAFLHATILIY